MMIGGTPVYPEFDVHALRCCGPESCGQKSKEKPSERYCIASKCMAWRWQPLLADDAFKDAVIEAREDLKQTGASRQDDAVKHVIKNREKYGLPPKPHLGYCGLAGEFLI